MATLNMRRSLSAPYPWTHTPLIVGAPMRVLSGPALAIAVSRAGGLGFIGPGAKPEAAESDLAEAARLLSQAPIAAGGSSSSPRLLSVGYGFQIWAGDLEVAAQAIAKHRPCAAWLFAPRHGQAELDAWTVRLRDAAPGIQIWVQIGTLREAKEAVLRSRAPPDVLVVQGAEAGGHGRATDGIGIVTLLPEIADNLQGSGVPIVAAGGIADGRGVVAALGLGAAGAVMGTRLLASPEARISKGYQDEVLRATDGAASTVRTQLYNHLRGAMDWPEPWSPRTIVNRSWEDHRAGVDFEHLKKLHDQAVEKGDEAWGPEGRTATYAGANVGLVKTVQSADVIVQAVRVEALGILEAMAGELLSVLPAPQGISLR